jgi:hypothetical protein
VLRPFRVCALVALAVPALVLARTAPSDAPRQDPAGAPTAGGVAAPEPGGGGVQALLAEADAAWPRRDEPGVLDREQAALDAALKLAPDDYDVVWRLARLEFWRADDPGLPKKEKSRLGKLAWDYGDRASQLKPDRVEGWNYAAAGMGNYALGIGILSALREGIEGKFKERLSRAEKIDPGFEHGAIQTAWGRFWFELPWPKYDPRKSEQALFTALQRNPHNVRARVYLADLNRKEDRGAEADQQLRLALSTPPGQYDAPEERRWQAVARARLADR